MMQETRSPRNTDRPADPDVATRIHHAIGPVMAAMILDFADLVTFGPIGLIAGAAVGASIGYWVSGISGFSREGRLRWAALAALYCTFPLTELVPLATIIAAAGRFRDPRRAPLSLAASGGGDARARHRRVVL